MIIDLLVEERRAKQLIENAKNEADEILQAAHKKAKEILKDATTGRSVDQLLHEEDVLARKKAKEMDIEFNKLSEEEIRKAERQFDQAVKYVRTEVLTVDRD